MAENTKISWATHTWNPWIGCSRVHTGCVNRYAEAMQGRLGVTWGSNGTRRRTAESTWRKVESWNRKAAAELREYRNGRGAAPPDRPRVFSSLCDWFEEWTGPIATSEWSEAWWYNGAMVDPPTGGVSQQIGYRPLMMADVRSDAFAVVDRCPNLDFLIATKRPENVRRMWEEKPQHLYRTPCDVEHRDNVWLGYSASDQATLDAGLPHLLACLDLVQVLWLSIEPLVGPVEIPTHLCRDDGPGCFAHGRLREWISWVVVGGESGPHYRPCEIEWIESIVDQCRAAGVPCWVKQDCGAKPGQQGRIPDRLWKVKELPCWRN